MRRLVLAGLLALAAHTADAAPPTLSNVNQQGCGGSSTCTFSVTTTHAPSVVIIQMGTQNPATTAPTISALVDNGAAGVTCSRRGSPVNTNNTTCLNGATSPCSGNSEVWWCAASSNLTSESFKATATATSNNFTASWGEISGLHSITSPWDTNASLPVTATVAAGVVPSISGFNTSEANDILFSYAHANGANNFVPCPVGSWGTSIANVATGNYNLSGRVNQVTSTQSLSFNLTSTSTCPAGNTGTDASTLQMDAMTADPPAVSGGTNIGLPIGPPPIH